MLTCFSVSVVKHCNREIAQTPCGVSIVERVKIHQDIMSKGLNCVVPRVLFQDILVVL